MNAEWLDEHAATADQKRVHNFAKLSAFALVLVRLGSGVEASASSRSHGKDILAACSDDGPIGLWRYPAPQVNQSLQPTPN